MSIVNGNGSNNGNASNGNVTKPNGRAEVPYRGTIIVDTDALFKLSVKIPQNDPAAKEDAVKTGTFLDFLPFLAKNGYRVLIPEVLLIESGAVYSINSLFDNNGIENKQGDRHFLGNNRKQILGEFLRDAVLPSGHKDKEYYNIEVVKNTGPVKIDKYCKNINWVKEFRTERRNEVRAVVNEKSHKTSILKENEAINEEARYIAQRLMSQKKLDKKRGYEYGDEAILSLLGKILPSYNSESHTLAINNGTGTPVFLLSDDDGLRKRAEKLFEKRVDTVTTTGFINAVIGSGLESEIKELKHLRNDGLTGQKLAGYLDKERREAVNKEETVRIDKEHHRNNETYYKFINSRPFTKSLKNLAEDLAKQNNGMKKEPEVNGNADGKSKVEQFLAREAKRSTAAQISR